MRHSKMSLHDGIDSKFKNAIPNMSLWKRQSETLKAVPYFYSIEALQSTDTLWGLHMTQHPLNIIALPKHRKRYFKAPSTCRCDLRRSKSNTSRSQASN